MELRVPRAQPADRRTDVRRPLAWALATALLTLVAGGCSTGDDPATATVSPPAAFVPPVPRLQRLLARQYTNAIGSLLGPAAALAAAPPDDIARNGFDVIGASELSLGDSAISAYESSARAVAAAAMSDAANIDALVGCAPTGPDDAACHRKLAERLGHLAFRRPLEQEEIDTYAAVSLAAATDLGDFHAGVEYAIATFLQSPSFLYQVALGVPRDDGLRELTGPELLTRMSFFLLDTTPDEGQLLAAEAGALDTADGVRALASELLERPQARRAVANLYAEIFRVREVASIAKDAEAYPTFSADVAASMAEETSRFFDDLIWESESDFRDLLTADYTFVNADLAAIYGVAAPPAGTWSRVTLPPGQGRSGLLGQASYLALLSHAVATSPTLRGKFVREKLLCQSIDAPPKGVITTLPEATADLTMRERLKQHQADPTCSFCHARMDDIGLGLESYDAIGAYRTTDHGKPIDLSGNLAELGAFTGARELGTLLHDRPEVSACMVRSALRGALGHVETSGEEAAIATLVTSFEGSGHRVKALLLAIVASDGFRLVGEVD